MAKFYRMMEKSTALYSLAILVYTFVSVSGLSLIKSSEQLASLKFLSGAFLYGLGFLIWIGFILRNLPLSIAFPVASGALVLGTMASAAFFLREAVSIQHWLGSFCIIIGIGLIYSRGVPQ